ncbi:E3 ubiquitin-protein ligase RNF10 [Achroia grisella]|uniref:E3 ubiquitin-protein ligase RNF10 n=1 Tax=Achroia grisella TaxID=688607 RepID=UPI0027D2848E|nr:E3 ubiquitin-protein ligase RNF10 [Achroia grisella]
MLEESRMDKKSINRSSQPQPRASAIDCKKNTDLTHKPWPRSNKKREGPNSAPKNEPYRKNTSTQRGRGSADRKPRPRGPSGFVVGGTQSAGIEEDDEPEIGSVLVPGSKKQNLNHLLNFMYPTRGGQDRRSGQPQPRRQGQRVSYRHEHDLYLRAYCQFILKEDGDYKANILDPDVPVNWEQIEEIVVRSTGRSECPICLGVAAAGRVGPCGHVYCWGCVLHYAAAHEKQPPPCPVCATSLNVQDMKPTRMIQWDSPTEEVTMRLVRRLRGSTTVEIAPPRGQQIESMPTPILPLESINNAPYSKFFTATKKQVHEILKRERMEIQNQILAEIDTTEIVYLEQALDMLKLKEDKLNNIPDKNDIVETVPEETVPIVYEKQEVNKNKIDWFDITDDGAASIEVIQDQMEELNIEIAASNLNPDAPTFIHSDINEKDVQDVEEFPLIENLPPSEIAETLVSNPTVTDTDKENQAKYFYFYQADDGQLVFLNSLNVRILNSSWGALSAAPHVIRGRVLHRETLSLSEQTRKHMPYTAHLPLHCSFDIVELDLQPPHVTAVALKNFTEELERRARIRARQQRDERRRERAYRRAMEGPPKPDFSSEVMFPPAAPLHISPILESTHSLEESIPTSSAASPPSSGPSFAKMASTSGAWRVRKPAAQTPPLPAADNEEGLVPRTLSLSDAIEAALHATPSPTNKKNKKNKHKVLFSMGMQRSA